MATELLSEDDKKKSIKDIYNGSVRLLELLNVIIPKVEISNPKVPEALISEISDLCFELGANLAMSSNTIGEEENDDSEYFPYAGGL